MGLTEVRLALQGFPELLRRFRNLALALQEGTEIVVRFGVRRIGMDRPPQSFLGFLVAAALHEQHAIVIVCLRKLIGVERQDRLVLGVRSIL